MSYVTANTANNLGRRPLGWYQHASFPLPTTSMSRPIRTRLGWDNAPYASYRQPESSRTRLSGEWVPPGPPPRAVQTQGAITYRVDPATGRYRFYSTDILPRGVWQQNPQVPLRPLTLSALGTPVPQGQQLVQLPNGMQVVSSTAPARRGCKSGNCKCHGRCKRLRGLGSLGDDCSSDSDCGPGGVCGAGVCYTVGTPPTTTTVNDPILGPTPIGANTGPIAPTTVVSPVTGSPAGALQSILSAFTQPRVTLPVPQAPSSGLRIGNTVIPNSALWIGGGILALGLMKKGGRR